MSFFEQMHPQWRRALKEQKDLLIEIENQVASLEITPEYRKVLAAYSRPLDDIKVVIFGQDPYPTPGVAQGYAFAINKNASKIPPTLRNIFKELQDDVGDSVIAPGNLTAWSDQGVFLLNRVLTTTPGLSLAHENIGWQEFTDATAQVLGDRGVVALLWGNKTNDLKKYFDEGLILTAPHPSPLSAYRGFFGSKPFSSINSLLIAQGKKPISW